jgi:hypothetical protein
MRRLAWLVLAILVPGCFEGGKGGDPCLLGEDRPAITAQLRNPETLLCQSFGGECDPACGPCPAVVGRTPAPTWGICGSSCENLDELSCAVQPECRIVRDARCAMSGTCFTDFIGCFPTDTLTLANIPCTDAHDGQTCSMIPSCTAFHDSLSCTDPPCGMRFAFCLPDGASPGRCEPAECRAEPPFCPPGTTPTVEDGCWTGACVPDHLCDVK